MFVKNKSIVYSLFPFLFLLIYFKGAATLVKMCRFSFETLISFPTRYQEWSQPFAGETMVHYPSVLDALQLLRQNDLVSYTLSSDLLANGEFFQRVSEGAWPIKHDPNSSHILMRTSDNKHNCLIIKQLKEITLVNCSHNTKSIPAGTR